VREVRLPSLVEEHEVVELHGEPRDGQAEVGVGAKHGRAACEALRAFRLEVARLGAEPLLGSRVEAHLRAAVLVGLAAGAEPTGLLGRGGEDREDEAPTLSRDGLEEGVDEQPPRAVDLGEPLLAVEGASIEVTRAVVGDLVALVDGLLREGAPNEDLGAAHRLTDVTLAG
jgi:hypothetical protein